MKQIWKVKYKEYTDIGQPKKRVVEKEGIFICETRDLEEIEEKKTEIFRGDQVYSSIEIISAEYLGEAEDLSSS